VVASLPHSAAHATTLTLGRTTADFCAGALGCFQRPGGLPEKAVIDNEGCMVKPRQGRAGPPGRRGGGLFGHLLVKPVILRPRFPRAMATLSAPSARSRPRSCPYGDSSRSRNCNTSTTAGPELWPRTVAWQRHHRRVRPKVDDAVRVERGYMRALHGPGIYGASMPLSIHAGRHRPASAVG
jgi:hypothetical protein